MINNRTIKEIYRCSAITSDEQLFPLQKWYNRLIEKTTDDIDVTDILRMLRQKVFVDLAIPTAIKLLQKDVYAGELYEGEVLEKLSEIENTLLIPFADELRDIVRCAIENCATHEWAYDGEDLEFKVILERLSEKIV